MAIPLLAYFRTFGFLILFCLFLPRVDALSVHNSAPSQLDSLKQVSLTAGVNLRYFFNTKGASNFSVGVAVGASKEIFTPELLVAYQGAVNVYFNGIGDNLMDPLKKTNVDFVNTFGLSAGMLRPDDNKDDYFVPYLTFNSMNPTVLENPYLWSVMLGTNIILNNHNRNQQTGFANFNLWRMLNFHYYNDGTPYDKVSLGDAYDRWWTGGGAIEFYLAKIESPLYMTNSKFFIHYDRFTGNVQDAFRVSNYLSLQFIPNKDVKQNFLNRAHSRYGLTHLKDNWHFSLDFSGHLETDIQDIIHEKLHMTKHISFASWRWFLGMQYSRLLVNQNINL